MEIYQVTFDVKTHDSGKKTYIGEMRHEGLGKHRVIRDTSENSDFIQMMINLQYFDWENTYWEVKLKNFKKQNFSQRIFAGLIDAEEGRDEAANLTKDIQSNLKQLKVLLISSLDGPAMISWEALKARHPPFNEESPKLLPEPTASFYLPKIPSREYSDFQPSISVLDMLIASRRDKKIAEAQFRYQEAVAQWQSDVDRITEAQVCAQLEYRASVDLIKAWEAKKIDFENTKLLRNAAIDSKETAYLALDPDAVVDYCDLVLYISNYPDFCPKEWELDYDPSSKQLIVDYLLPAPDDLPSCKGVKWVTARSVLEEQKLTETAKTKIYDDVVYQIILRTTHEIVNADAVNAIHSVVINGVVNSIDRGTGKKVTACILSLRVEAAQFKEINLAQVDPKTCFKSLKGVGSAKLHGLSPIAPIMTINKSDARFVASYGVADSLDSGVNLAAMGWEDFEHLIRELFEKEFSSNGGEVRVTQASRDGGVDAIAFDPDPIRGGKIVIQAKRYTNTVGVSAVRDLYGTVLNEGATKGVLVTTSDYGPDSYSFAQGKPLVLLSGANLLHMLEKHGHKAKIDIREAKKMFAAGDYGN